MNQKTQDRLKHFTDSFEGQEIVAVNPTLLILFLINEVERLTQELQDHDQYIRRLDRITSDL